MRIELHFLCVGDEKVKVGYAPPSNLFKRTRLNVVFCFRTSPARSHHAVIPVYDEAGDVIEKHEGKRAAAGEARLGAVTDAQQSCITRYAFSPMRKQMLT